MLYGGPMADLSDEDLDARFVWDDDIAAELVGRVMLAGISYIEPDGSVARRQQVFGEVVSVDPRRGIAIRLMGSRAGETFRLPPDTRSIQPASPGEYRLHSTNEVVVDPDFLVTFAVHRRPDN